VGKEDWDFLARVVAGGYRMIVVPEQLFWYRESDTRIRSQHLDNLPYARRSAGEIRVLRPYVESFAPLSDLIFLAKGLEHTRGQNTTGSILEHLKDLKIAAERLARLRGA